MGTKISVRRIVLTTRWRPATPSAESKSDNVYNVTSYRVGADDPKYRSRINAGISASNVFDAYRQRIAWSPAEVSWRHNSFPNNSGFSSGFMLPTLLGPGIPSGLLADAKNKAAIGIRKKIDSETTSVSGGVIMVELRKTLKMIRRPADAMRTLTTKFINQREASYKRAQRLHVINMKRAVHKQRPIPGYTVRNGNLRETADALAKSWLEYSFGMIPLMSDVAAIAEAALTKFSKPSIKRLAFTAQAASSSSLAGITTPAGSVVECPYSKETTDEVSCRYTVGYKVDVSGTTEGFRRVYDQSGFDLAHVVPTIWETLPWSFLIDYFTNIGDVIGTNQVALTNVAWSQLTTRRNHKQVISVSGSKGYVNPAYYKFLGGSDYLCSSSIVEVKRTAAGIPFGELRFELPGKQGQYNNMAALLWTQLKH